MAICDVSGSVCTPAGGASNQCLHAAIGMSLLLAELAKPPFNDPMVTFSGTPELHQLDQGGSFTDKVNEIRSMRWGFNTNLHDVFVKLLLPLAKEQSTS